MNGVFFVVIFGVFSCDKLILECGMCENLRKLRVNEVDDFKL